MQSQASNHYNLGNAITFFTSRIICRGFIGLTGAARTPCSELQCPWYYLFGKINFCVIAQRWERKVFSLWALSCQHRLSLQLLQDWDGHVASRERFSGWEWSLELCYQLPARIWSMRKHSSSPPPHPNKLTHHYSQRIGSCRMVLKWGLLLLCHGQWPTQLCLLKEEWGWGALRIYEADCVRFLWLPFIPKCLDWLWKAVTQIDFYWADSLSMFERTQVKDGVSHPIQAVCLPTKGVGQPEGRVSWPCFFW